MNGGVPDGGIFGRTGENCSPHLHRKASQKVTENRKRFFNADEYSQSAVCDQTEDGKVELTMKKYVKPRLRCLGLLRLVTKFSF
jgi:hypothetical protein